MLTKPDLENKEIIKCLWDSYELAVKEIVFLPLGADFNTAVYRVTTSNKEAYFLKLRHGQFNKASVLIQKYLVDLGFKQIIPPLPVKTGKLWATLASFKATLYPYIEGHNGVALSLSEKQWIDFGSTLKKIHSVRIPPEIIGCIPQEAFDPKWLKTVRVFLERVENEIFEEPLAQQTAAFLKSKTHTILALIKRAEELVDLLQKKTLEFILCHADIHGWNLHINKEGALYIIDWDTLILAPKERDLMFVGAGIWDSGRTSFEEESLFYQGYGPTIVDKKIMEYYRLERVVQDIGEHCNQIFLLDGGEEDRARSFMYLQSFFLPNGAINKACSLPLESLSYTKSQKS